MRTSTWTRLAGVVALLSSLSSPAHAATIAVIDSGTDYKHPDLVGQIWNNPGETDGNQRDDDGNGKMDDFHGWNFAESNSKVIDYRYLGTFGPDVTKFFEIQLRIISGNATPEDKEWLKKIRTNSEFIAELQKFGNFVHGTHVAGIAARDNQSKIMALKIIPTEVKLPFKLKHQFAELDRMARNAPPSAKPGIDWFRDYLIKNLLGMLAKRQNSTMNAVGLYVWRQRAQVANCSFGTSTRALQGMLGKVLPILLRRPATEEETLKYAQYAVEQMIEEAREFMVTARESFFVVAAGNDGENNDKFPAFPAAIRRANSITVAATRGDSTLASFSNYGEKTVDIAAPGVGIVSAIPGATHLAVSGTSQAAPFVANVAARILERNPSLRPGEVRRILMSTVDAKDFLQGKVASGGMANPDRAVEAARLSKLMPLDDALRLARRNIARPWQPETKTLDQLDGEEGFVVPLPSMIGL